MDSRGGSEAGREERGGEVVLGRVLSESRVVWVVLVSGELGGEFWYLWHGGWREDVLTWVSGV
jgi:hypothetical protein